MTTRFSLTDYLKRISKARVVRRYGFRSVLFCAAVLFAQGAPLGYLFWFENHSGLLAYIWIGTSTSFGIFGWVIGYFVDHLTAKLLSMEQSMVLSKHFEQMKKSFITGLTDNIQSPVSVAIEFLESLRTGLFGPVNEAQISLAAATLQELHHLHGVFDEMLSSRKMFRGGLETAEMLCVREVMIDLKGKFARTGRSKRVHFQMPDDKHNFPIFADRILLETSIEQVINAIGARSPRATVEVHTVAGDPRPHPQFAGSGEFCDIEDAVAHLVIQCRTTQVLDDVVLSMLGRFDRLKPVKDHTNLDLFMAKSVLEWHGCDVWLDPQWNGGARVVVTIPPVKEVPVPKPKAGQAA